VKFTVLIYLPSILLIVITIALALANPKSPAPAITMLLAMIAIGAARRWSRIYWHTRIRARAWKDARRRR